MRQGLRDTSTAARLAFAGLVLLAGAAGVAQATSPERAPERVALSALPAQVDAWHGRDGARFADAVVQVLGVEEYLNRVYAGGDREQPVSLYVGYYASQRQGDTIHSPMNCLPGAGWQPVSNERVALDLADHTGAPRRVVVNQYVVQKGADRQLVLYWYQSHGRVVASEYVSRALMVYDAIRLNRTDAALVRVVTPVGGAETADLASAARRAASFVTAIFPPLSALLPA